MSSSSLSRISGPFGAVGPVRRVTTDGWLPPQYSMFSAATGNSSAVIGPYRADAKAGTGTGRAYADPDRARLLAISEAVERYAALVIDERLVTCASAEDLGEDALDLGSVARCSVRELSRPECPLAAADKSAPIRWVAGTELLSGRDVFLPVIMVYLQPAQLPAERFWLPISTGCAVHVSLESALLNALLEVIERDAIAVTWLQRLTLPRLSGDCVSDIARRLIDWCLRRGIRTHLFDATTDVGIPTVYCVQTTAEGRSAAQLIGCSCAFDAVAAAEHAIMEAMGVRFGIQRHPKLPPAYCGFASVGDGAAYMAMRTRRDAFSFLLADLAARRISTPRPQAPAGESDRLAYVLDRLSALGMPVYACDISPRELGDTPCVAVRVIVPGLQPMSVIPLVQYLSHPRLFQAPAGMGLTARRARHLNPYPQPMA